MDTTSVPRNKEQQTPRHKANSEESRRPRKKIQDRVIISRKTLCDPATIQTRCQPIQKKSHLGSSRERGLQEAIGNTQEHLKYLSTQLNEANRDRIVSSQSLAKKYIRQENSEGGGVGEVTRTQVDR